MKPPLPYDRGKQILKLLALNKPLSVLGLSQILEPKIAANSKVSQKVQKNRLLLRSKVYFLRLDNDFNELVFKISGINFAPLFW